MARLDKQEKMKELTDKLEQGIKDIYESDRYKNYLAVMSKFHSYSFRNSLLIMLQKPEATHVAGFNAWKNNFNRYVNKGEKGLQILAPTPYRVKVEMEKIDPKTQTPILDNSGKPVTELVEITKPAFRPVYVFDVSQTSGEPLPQLITELTGNVSQYPAFFESLKSVAPFPIQFEDIQSGAKGYCDPLNQKIAIKTGMSEIQNIKTAIHEITHSDLHADSVNLSMGERKDRRTKEVEAESVAFVVCNHYGIDTSNYSFAYVASWSSNRELNELKSSLDTIQKQAAELIDRIDTRFTELLKEQPLLSMPDSALTTGQETNERQDDDSHKMLPLDSKGAVELFDKNDQGLNAAVNELQAERTFTIYQLKSGEDNHYRRGESYKELRLQGEQPDIKNYDLVYTSKMDQSATLENIYQEFNINKPADFTGHSLSMSDIVVVKTNGVYTANYIDTFGYVSCPDFAWQHEQELNKRDGVYYGQIDFSSNTGEVGETIYYKDKPSFDKEVSESNYIGRPIQSQVYDNHRPTRDDAEDKARYNEYLDSVKFDNDIDLDREKTREQLGFKDNVKPLTMAERMAVAKEAAKERSKAQKQNRDPEKEKRRTKARAER